MEATLAIRSSVPTNARAIQDRLNEITFNATLVEEIEAIDAVNELKPPDSSDRSPYKRIRLHEIKDEPHMAKLGYASKTDTDWPFLLELRDFGRRAAEGWLSTSLESVGRKSTAAWRCCDRAPARKTSIRTINPVRSLRRRQLCRRE